MFNMTWEEAQQAMREGKRVKNTHFTSEEFFYMENGRLLDEEGYPMVGWYKGYDWQEDGWMIVEENFKPFESTVSEYDLSALEKRVISFYDFQLECYKELGISNTYKSSHQTPNYNYRITKGRGHNKYQKRKKK